MSADGRREVLGCAVGDSETHDFWTEFLRTLRDRGLGGTQVVISEHHRALVNPIEATIAGVAWQRCRVHFMRNVLAKVTKDHWRKVWSTTPLERLNRNVKRRTDVVGIFPNPASLLHLATCVLIESHDESQVAEHHYLSEESMAQLTPPTPTTNKPEVIDTNTIHTAQSTHPLTAIGASTSRDSTSGPAIATSQNGGSGRS